MRILLTDRACPEVILSPKGLCTLRQAILRPCRRRLLQNQAAEPLRPAAADCLLDRIQISPSSDAHLVSKIREALRAESVRAMPEKKHSCQKETRITERHRSIRRARYPTR